MKDHRLPGWRIAVFSIAIAYFWFFPPDLFRDCIHVVFGTAQTDDAYTDAAPDDARAGAAPNCILTEEDYLDLFHMESSEYKIAWKFF